MNKKLTPLMIVTSFASLFAVSALSAPIANLKISGDIKPPTCTINGGNDNIVYEYNISPSLLPLEGNLTLPPQSQPIQVQCDAATFLSLTPVDNRAGTELVQGLYNFGLGSDSSQNNIGYYEIVLRNGGVKSSLDSDVVTAGFKKSLTSLTYDSFKLDKTASMSWTKGSGNSNFAVGQVFLADIVVTPTINGALRSSTDSVNLDGDATLQFSFGL